MSTANLNVFRNGTFVFEVGGSRFTVHKDLVARKSKVLKAMMESGMQESQNGVAPLQDVDELSFGRFVEYLYTGDYNPTQPERHGQSQPPPEHSAADSTHKLDPATLKSGDTLPWQNEGTDVPSEDQIESSLPPVVPPMTWSVFKELLPREDTRKKKKKKSTSTKPKQLIPHSEFRVRAPLPTSSLSERLDDKSLDYLPTFLSHAQLYVFADTYDIPGLQTLAASRLRFALSQFEYSQVSSTEIIDLVTFVYDHTAERGDEPEKLRTIVTHFCAVNVGALRFSKSFVALLRSEDRFADALLLEIDLLLSKKEPKE